MKYFTLELYTKKQIFICWMILCRLWTIMWANTYLRNVLKVTPVCNTELIVYNTIIYYTYINITDFLKEKTCILITHQLQYLTNVDQIVLLENVTI